VRGGGSDTGFLTAVYTDVLQRGTDPLTGVWGQMLSQGASRGQVVDGIRASVEADGVTVQTAYKGLLCRVVEDQGLSFWVSRLQNGLKMAVFLVELLASEQYYTKATLR
jgi:hypothetical protein